MIVTKTWIEENYIKFNNLYFGGTLPIVTFKVTRSKHTFGYASYRYDYLNNTIIPESLSISNYYDSPEEVKIQTLLHEMIHIEDYFWHPEHFIKNHRPVSGRTYDAHGIWFQHEANRINKESGYKIDTKATQEELNVSVLSERSKRNVQNAMNNALICAITGENGVIFYFKTDIFKAPKLRATLPFFNWYRIDKIKSIKFYKFVDERLASMRSCTKKIRGWHTSRIEFMNKMMSIKATEIHI